MAIMTGKMNRVDPFSTRLHLMHPERGAMVERNVREGRTGIRGTTLHSHQDALEYATALELEIEKYRNLAIAASSVQPGSELLKAGLSLLDAKLRPKKGKILLLCS